MAKRTRREGAAFAANFGTVVITDLEWSAMSKTFASKPTPRQAMEWVKEAGNGSRRLLFTEHAETRMKQRHIARRQILEALKNGLVSEPLHEDERGDWRCNLSWFHAGARVTVGVIFKLDDGSELAVVATVVEG